MSHCVLCVYHFWAKSPNHSVFRKAQKGEGSSALLMIFLALLEQFKMCSKVFFLTFEEEEGMKIFSRSKYDLSLFQASIHTHFWGENSNGSFRYFFVCMYIKHQSKNVSIYILLLFVITINILRILFFFSCRWILSSFENNEIVQFFLFFSDQWTKVWKTTYCFLALGNKVVKIIWSLRAKRE